MSTVHVNRCDQSEMTCAYAAQALAESELAAAEAHIASCPDCRRELESLRPVVDRFVSWPTDLLRPTTSLQGRLALRIAAALGGRQYVDGRVGATSVPAKLFPLQIAIAIALMSMDVTSPPDPGLEASMDWIRCHVPPPAVGDEPWRAAAIVSELFRALGKIENRSERVLNDRRRIFERLAW